MKTCRSVIKWLFRSTLIAVILISACSEDDAPGPGDDLGTFEGVVNSGGDFEDFTEMEDITVVDEDKDTVVNGEAWKCTVKTYDIVDGNEDFPLFDPNASVIYPGSLLQGGTLDQATPDVIVVKRAPGVISYDLINANAAPSFNVEPELTKSGVATAMNAIISNSPDAIAANFSLTVEEVQSREELALEIGLDVETRFVEVESNLSFSTDQSYNRFLIKLNQSYYTMSWDLPTSLESIFDPSVTPADLAEYVGPGNPPVYISDVTYGRIFYMLIESTESATKMEAAIDASYGNFAGKVSGSLDASHLESLSNLKVKMIAYGGDAAGTLEMVGVTDLGVIRDRLAQSTDIRTAKPISYVVRSVKDNQEVAVKLATQYDVTTCVPAAPGKFEFLTLQSADLSIDPGYKTFIGDANGDGSNDIILNKLGAGTNQVQVVLGNANGNFTPGSLQPHTVTTPVSMSWTDYEMKIGDINNDGITDLIWSNQTDNNDFDITDNTNYVAIGQGSGEYDFSNDPLVFTAGWGDDYVFHILDINGDGSDDILWNEQSSDNRIYTALSDGISGFDLVSGFQDHPSPTINSWYQFDTFIADVNGDGFDDLVWEERELNERVFFAIAKTAPTDHGKFDFGDEYLFGFTNWAGYETLIGDVDADGRDDVILQDTSPSRPNDDRNPIYVGFSDGTTIGSTELTRNLGPGVDTHDILFKAAAADINRDGRTDILWNDKDGLTNDIFVGLAKIDQTGDNIFSFETATQTHPDGNVDWDSFQNPVFADVNGDQKPDIIWIRPQGTIGIYVALAY